MRASSTMVTILAVFLAAVPLSDAGADAQGETDDDHPLSADALLDEVLLRFPREPMAVEGELIVRRRRGVETVRYGFEMNVNWAAVPARISYSVRDALGREIEQARLTLASGRPALVSGTDQAAGAPIGASDVTRTDLAMSYLWWRGGTIVGEGTAKGRTCYLVDVPAPEGEVAPGNYAKVRLWIDQKLHMMLQAEGYDGSGNVVRRMWVRSLKKTDGKWVIKNLEVQGFPAVQRTRVYVRDIRSMSDS